MEVTVTVNLVSIILSIVAICCSSFGLGMAVCNLIWLKKK